jgi:hypothetical protein
LCSTTLFGNHPTLSAPADLEGVLNLPPPLVEEIELGNLTNQPNRSLRPSQGEAETATKEAARAKRRREKFERLLDEEAMKFSHSIQFNAVPDWSSNYIAYSNLKKL